MILLSNGFELGNYLSDGWELDAETPTITTTARSGSYAVEMEPLDSIFYNFGQEPVIYVRAYFYLDEDIDDGTAMLMQIEDATGDINAGIRFSISTNKLLGYNRIDPDSQTPSPVVSLNAWHSIELFVDSTDISNIQYICRMDGTTFVTHSYDKTGETANQINKYLTIGLDIEGGDTNTGHIIFDDIVIDDEVWPGEAEATTTLPYRAMIERVKQTS